jgi:hypothetical protein
MMLIIANFIYYIVSVLIGRLLFLDYEQNSLIPSICDRITICS